MPICWSWSGTKIILPCHEKTYDNAEAVRRMIEAQGFRVTENGDMELSDTGVPKMAIPSELVPRCPVCGAPMTMNLRCDNTFVEDEGWHQAAERYEIFIRRHKNMHILFLELGVGANTPVIIKYPFWQMTAGNPKAVYACVNRGEAMCPHEIENQSICIDGDIGKVLEKVKSR